MDGGISQHPKVNSYWIFRVIFVFPQNSITILACACDTTGSKSEVCDKSSGKCDCNDNVVGDKCTQCSTEHWGFPSCQSG